MLKRKKKSSSNRSNERFTIYNAFVLCKRGVSEKAQFCVHHKYPHFAIAVSGGVQADEHSE